MKKILLKLSAAVLVAALIATLAGCGTNLALLTKVDAAVQKLNVANAYQTKMTTDMTIGGNALGQNGDIEASVSGNIIRSGEDYYMKLEISGQAMGEDQTTEITAYIKDRYAYVDSGTGQYMKMESAQAMQQFSTSRLALVTSAALKNAKFAVDEMQITVGGEAMSVDRVKITMDPEKVKDFIREQFSSQIGSQLGENGAQALDILFAMMEIDDFSYTLYLNGDDIARIETVMKLNFSLLGQGIDMDMSSKMDIIKVADSIEIQFPEFNDSNTVDALQ
ncbi:MAG: hypothetical protein Q8O09_05890 [Bacillota bacterium]|nr:hypothetical protein [Bacillota bacterium]